MISVGLRPAPEIFEIASSSRLRSYVMSIAIDEGPVDTIPNMSPSWISSFEIFLNNSRMRPVLLKSMWRSSTKIMKMRPDASLVGRGGGSRMPAWSGGGGAAMSLMTRPPCVSTNVTRSCLTPSSYTSKSTLERFETNCP
jgi:hypothetical protein